MKQSTRFLASAAAFGLAIAGLTTVNASAASKTVVIETDFTGVAMTDLQAEMDHWSKTSGVKVKINGDNNFTKDIVTQVKTKQTPDIAIWAQPGGLLAQSAALQPLDSLVDVKKIASQLIPGAASLAVKNNKTYGLLWSANLKSLLWYNSAALAKGGYTVPKSYADLTALSSKIIADKAGYPFCVGGGATWVLTDWVEQYVADLYGAKVYNDWVAGTVKFTDPRISGAIQKIGDLLLASGAVNDIANQPYNFTSPLFVTGGLKDNQCFMYKQGSFAAGFFPPTYEAAVLKGDNSTLDVTGFPVVTGGKNVIEGGGNTVAAFSKDASTVKVLKFLLSPDFGHYFAQSSSGFFLSPFKNFDTSYYPNAFRKKFAQTLQGAGAFVFDASDQMKPAVGDAFGNEMVAWVGGKETLADALKKIDAANA